MSILETAGYGQAGGVGWLRNMAQDPETRDRQPGAAFPASGRGGPELEGLKSVI